MLAKLEGTGADAVAASRQAARSSAAAYFDLIGLPPTAEEVEAFAKDDVAGRVGEADRPAARVAAVRRAVGPLLARLARYADTKGYVFQEDAQLPVRVHVPRLRHPAFNEDKPYDRFVIEQLAADQLPLGDDKRPLAAMGFLTLGRRFLNNQQDIIDDRIDVVTRGLMGLTVDVRPVPRPQVRPDPDEGLLLALRRVRQHQRAEGTAADRRGEADAGGDRVREGSREARGRVQGGGGQAARGDAEEAPRRRTRSPSTSAAVLDARKAKPAGQLQAFVRERDLNRFAFERGGRSSPTQLKAQSPVFARCSRSPRSRRRTSRRRRPRCRQTRQVIAKKPVNAVVLEGA